MNLRPGGARLLLSPPGIFCIFASLVLILGARLERLYDSDSYYNLAVARHLWDSGAKQGIPWARFSVLADAFADKEFLFHVLLVPFARLASPVLGGVLALALLNGLLAALIARVSIRLTGRWGALVPFVLWSGSYEFLLRVLRLRSEILSLALLLLGLEAAAARRYRLLGLLGFLYALSYIAIHAFVGLFALCFLSVLVRDAERDWKLLGAPLLGAALGVLVHPQFPANVLFWKIVSFDVLRMKGVLDSGQEFRPQFLVNALTLNLGWLICLAVLFRSRVRSGDPAPGDRMAPFTAIAALAFGLLYAEMGRFALYAVPLAMVAFLAAVRARGEAFGPFTRLPFGRTVPTGAALGGAFLIGLTSAHYVGSNLRAAGALRPGERAEMTAFAAALPRGATVAAFWGDAETYVFWAPEARYLNLLDPALMAVPYPHVYDAQRAVFDGIEPDVPLVVEETLESDFLAFHRVTGGVGLEERLRRDPRVEIVHQGENLVARLSRSANAPFVLDWRVVEAPAPPDSSPETWALARSYPRLPPASGFAVEGFVDARRVRTAGAGGGLAFLHEEVVTSPTRLAYELAASGPAGISVDGLWVASVGGSGAILGRGTTVPLQLGPGTHRIVVWIAAEGPRPGFYLLERGR